MRPGVGPEAFARLETVFQTVLESKLESVLDGQAPPPYIPPTNAEGAPPAAKRL